MENKTNFVKPADFDPIYNNSDELLLEEVIKRELKKANVNLNQDYLPMEALKRKKFLNVIFSILLFIYISSIFFHLSILYYILGLIILLIFYNVTKKYNLIKYLKKEIKARPNEKISNIIMNTKNSFVRNDLKKFKKITFLISITLPLIIFLNPKVIYEKSSDGYTVRFYAFGLTNFSKVKINETYKGEKVVGIRGKVFKNMYLLREVKLPDTITEIRGQAFKNNFLLKTINLPKNLKYLGGGAFYNNFSLKSIELPDTLIYMGGETFFNAISLENVKLSESLIQIRGNTFENCTSLKTIDIPDSVTRIGGHAFYLNEKLESVNITKYSNLTEIGSSAFRRCYNLKKIKIPSETYVNERAFKESPTTVEKYGWY